MSCQIIKSTIKEGKAVPDSPFLRVSEFFYDTIQGEGVCTGHPATFLRLQNCTLNCTWCDTKEVWRKGNPYTIIELLDRIYVHRLDMKLKKGQHLVITGGSPLMQQKNLITFIKAFIRRFGFKPFIEIENEAVIIPDVELVSLIDCWNNSPKLASSGNNNAYKPKVLKVLSRLPNSWFKFVVTCPEDWEEIQTKYIFTGLISKNQVILMPEGATIAELQKNREKVVEICVENNVRYSTREHVVIWDKKTGV